MGADAVDTSIDRDRNGAVHMEVNFTGTNEQLTDLKRTSRTAVEARAGDGSTIRDYTGSGVGNSPDETSSSGSSSGRVRLVIIFELDLSQHIFLSLRPPHFLGLGASVGFGRLYYSSYVLLGITTSIMSAVSWAGFSRNFTK